MSPFYGAGRAAAYYSFAADACERAVKTAAQAAVLALGADAVDAFTVQWQDVAGLAAGGFALSFLTSVASIPFGTKGAASVVPDAAPQVRTAQPANNQLG